MLYALYIHSPHTESIYSYMTFNGSVPRPRYCHYGKGYSSSVPLFFLGIIGFLGCSAVSFFSSASFQRILSRVFFSTASRLCSSHHSLNFPQAPDTIFPIVVLGSLRKAYLMNSFCASVSTMDKSEALRSGQITQDEYDAWRYHYPTPGQTTHSHFEEVPAQE